MDVRVKLFGPLSRQFEGYNPGSGMDINLPDGARVIDLLAHLDISDSDGYMVIVDGRINRPAHRIEQGSILQILPVIAGG